MPETIFELPTDIFLRPQQVIQPQENEMPFTPGQIQDDLLEALFVLYYADARRLNKHLGRRETSINQVKNRLTELVREEYIVVVNEEQRKKHPTYPAVYGIGRKGRIYLKDVKGKPINWRYRGIKERISENYPIKHTLSVVDLLILAIHLGKEEPYIKLTHNVHEIELKREPILVPYSNGTYRLKPDLLLDFDRAREQQLMPCEVTRTLPHERTWREKVRVYILADAPFKKRFGNEIATVPVIVAGNNTEQRMQTMMDWTRKEMTELGQAHHDDFFMFTTASFDLSPREFFMNPHWYIPFSERPEPLILPVRGGYSS